MASDANHKILIVGDEKRVVNSLKPVLYMDTIDISFAADGETGLNKIQAADPPFSLIISDQRLSGMEGLIFLERARELAPGTIRYLIARYSDMETIIDSVNKGLVHRYVSMSWEKQDFLQAVSSGLKQYQIIKKGERHLLEAKKLNKKLYKLDCELMASTKHLDRELESLDREIDLLEEQLKFRYDRSEANDTDKIIAEMETAVTSETGVDEQEIDRLYVHIVKGLYRQFAETAKADGFQMPQPDGRR